MLAGKATQRLVLRVTALMECQVVLATAAMMVESLAEKVEYCLRTIGTAI